MVIRSLAHGKGAHVPYRDSKLTRLLQNCLGGNAHTVAVCNITLADVHADETKNSLRFASFTKSVVNKASKNVAFTSAELLRDYKAQISALKSQLSMSVDEQVPPPNPPNKNDMRVLVSVPRGVEPSSSGHVRVGRYGFDMSRAAEGLAARANRGGAEGGGR
eukprot:7605747-Pyramimonas_sp.AAC.1